MVIRSAALSLIAIAAISAILVAQSHGDFRQAPYLRIDPDRIVVEDAKGFRPCGECHSAEWEVWKTTTHSTGFETMHRSESGQDIQREMGLRVAKRQEAICMRCHYTVGPNRRAIAGISCESCHGPARDWVNVHNRWGGGAKTREDETPAAREQRITASRRGGMQRPSDDLYAVVANCFECHTIPVEELINRAGHKTGTATFDLTTQVDKIRHNFLHGDGQNRPASRDRTRVMFVIGRMLAYEYSLRGLAAATVEGRYATAMIRAVKKATTDLEALAPEIPGVVEILKIGAAVRLTANNRTEIETAADEMRQVAQRFAKLAAGTELAAIDRHMPGAARTQATGQPNAGTQTTTPAPPVAPVTPTVNPPSPNTVASAAEQTLPSAGSARPRLPGEIRNRPTWRSPVEGIVGANECAGCHEEGADWWDRDAHSRAGRRLLGENSKARQIAELYGIGAANMARPDRICMHCHGTVDDDVQVVAENGVSCESCHGPGKKYLEPHKKGGNPQLGMRALKRPADRVQTCAGCHHITDQRLLASGHPSGANYDIVSATSRIKHWPGQKPERGRQKRGEPIYAAPPDHVVRAAYHAQVAGRPIPKVTVVTPAPPALPVAAASSGNELDKSMVSTQTPGKITRSDPTTAASSLRPNFPNQRTASRPPVSMQLEPMPRPDQLTAEEILLMLKRRIERIHAAMRQGN